MTIVTIREASWLTDNTYTYEEVVRMMGDVIAALHGDLRVSHVYRVREWEKGGCVGVGEGRV